jgi:hypothetical protein
MVEIDMTAPTVAPVVRDRAMYRTRGGAEVQVSYNQSGADNPFYSNAPKQWYFPNGSVNRNRAPHVNDLIAIIPAPDSAEPDAQRADPIAHLFEDVPASRRFVGGEVIPGILLLIPESKVVISVGKVLGTDVCKHITPADARNLAAAILAAADALETGESK